MEHEDEYVSIRERAARHARTIWLVIEYAFDRLIDMMGKDISIIRREGDLFFGMALVIVGVFDFQSGKYCDGNTTDYLSCTRPSTYYYYSWWEILFILAGVFLMTLWFLKRGRND